MHGNCGHATCQQTWESVAQIQGRIQAPSLSTFSAWRRRTSAFKGRIWRKLRRRVLSQQPGRVETGYVSCFILHASCFMFHVSYFILVREFLSHGRQIQYVSIFTTLSRVLHEKKEFWLDFSASLRRGCERFNPFKRCVAFCLLTLCSVILSVRPILMSSLTALHFYHICSK